MASKVVPPKKIAELLQQGKVSRTTLLRAADYCDIAANFYQVARNKGWAPNTGIDAWTYLQGLEEKTPKILFAKVDLPACWKKLIDYNFPDDLTGCLSEKTDHWGIADPRPHYDDCRTVGGMYAGAAQYTFEIELVSGQANHFARLAIYENRDLIFDDVYQRWEDLKEVKYDGRTFKLDINWV